MPGLYRDNTEAFVASGFALGRAAVGAGEEVAHRLSEVPQRLLLHHLGAFTKPIVPGPGLGELPTLLQVTRRCTASGPPPGLLLHREVPDEPGVRAVVSQHCFLSGRRCQAVAGHSNTLSGTTDILEEVKWRVLRDLNAGVSTPRSR